MDVVAIAAIVPRGMERCASFRSPERLEPAMMPTVETIQYNETRTIYYNRETYQALQHATTRYKSFLAMSFWAS